MPEAAFNEKIREEFPAVQGDFCLFRVDRQRRIHRLELTSVCPAAIKACSVLRRSAVYIRKMENGEEEVRNIHGMGDGMLEENQNILEEQNRLEEEEQNLEVVEEDKQNGFDEEEQDRSGKDIFIDPDDNQSVARESTVLLQWRALRCQQDEEYQVSLQIDRERERRRRQLLERELRRVHVINTRNEWIDSIPEPENGMVIQFKYPDGGLKRRRFLPSQLFQDLVAFAGNVDMASEIFSLQKAMSPISILSTQRGSLADNGITAQCTLYILWMSGDEVENIISNSSIACGPYPVAPSTTFSPAPSPPTTITTCSPAPSSPIPAPIFSPAPSPPTTITTISPAPSSPIAAPIFSPAPSPSQSPSFSPSSPDQEDIEEAFDIAAALQTLKARVHHLAPTANQINVLRDEEFECALRAFNRPTFDAESKLDIVFIDEDGRGEGAVDDGGPTREFCRLLMGKLQGHQIFEGPPEERTLALDSIALHTNTYKSVGQMLSVCLIHGGVSPNFFSKRLFSQVFGLPSGPATIEDVVDHGLRAKLEKINSADTLDDAREAVSETAEELALMGALRHLRSLEHRKELMEAVLQFYCEGRINAALTQFKDGLTTLGVLQMVTSHPQAFEKVFLYDPTPLKASDIVELFHARCRSLPASNRRRKVGVSLPDDTEYVFFVCVKLFSYSQLFAMMHSFCIAI
uniref:G2/M phase-specific E3 ubiquitin-protein ligase-like n=1 Tax=Astyanax mexicanus TaxID=7994 RepID=A0A3B1KJW9_ASTMX